MKKVEDTKDLKNVKAIAFIIFIIASGLIAFWRYYLVGGILVLVGIFIQWKFYRCPNCNKNLDPRMKLKEETYCSNCGEVIRKSRV